jgi:peptide-methionine (S)-S-oxide reductase
MRSAFVVLLLLFFAQQDAAATESVIVAAGCFWSVELVYQRVPGVLKTRVGYCGGTTEEPTYEDVGYGDTGHGECVEIVYDPKAVSAADLLRLFWEIHDPTQLNRQGGDVGTQYRSTIFYTSPESKQAAVDSLAEHQRALGASKKIATTVEGLSAEKPFWPAESYHQQYLEKDGQEAAKGDLSNVRCYGNRAGPVKQLQKSPFIRELMGRGGEGGGGGDGYDAEGDGDEL